MHMLSLVNLVVNMELNHFSFCVSSDYTENCIGIHSGLICDAIVSTLHSAAQAETLKTRFFHSTVSLQTYLAFVLLQKVKVKPTTLSNALIIGS